MNARTRNMSNCRNFSDKLYTFWQCRFCIESRHLFTEIAKSTLYKATHRSFPSTRQSFCPSSAADDQSKYIIQAPRAMQMAIYTSCTRPPVRQSSTPNVSATELPHTGNKEPLPEPAMQATPFNPLGFFTWLSHNTRVH